MLTHANQKFISNHKQFILIQTQGSSKHFKHETEPKIGKIPKKCENLYLRSATTLNKERVLGGEEPP